MSPTHAAVTIAAAALAPSSLAGPLDLNFDAGIDGWRVVLDGVMGGRSTGRVGQLERGILRFSGTLSLENNGGFSQIRTEVPPGALAGARGVELRVRGDGRTYLFNLRTSDVQLMAGGFQAAFETTGDWQTIRIPFDRFQLTSFGRRVPNPPALSPSLIESLGVTLADKQARPFELSIDSIRAFSGSADAPVTATSASPPDPGQRLAEAQDVLNVLERAIGLGVPLFNAGAPQACAAVYDVAVTGIVELAPQALDDRTRVDLEQALADAASETDPRGQAWTLRRAMDRAYEALTRRVEQVAAR